MVCRISLQKRSFLELSIIDTGIGLKLESKVSSWNRGEGGWPKFIQRFFD